MPLRRSLFITALALLLLGPQSAFALDCDKATTTVDMNECASQEQKRVEAKLNATYKATLAYLDRQSAAGAKTKLIKAQRAWIKFRDADCAAVYELYASGTIRTLMWIGCRQARAEQRIEELEALSDNDG